MPLKMRTQNPATKEREQGKQAEREPESDRGSGQIAIAALIAFGWRKGRNDFATPQQGKSTYALTLSRIE